MSLKTIAGQDYEDVCAFQSDNGKIYVAMRDTDTPEPVELIGKSDMFTYGCVESDSECTLFKRIIDQAKGVTVGAIYAESGRDAVQQYLDKGDNASLITIINNALGRF